MANADQILSRLAQRIVEARAHELKNKVKDGPGMPITLGDIGFAFEHLLPGLPVSLHVNDHAEQCDCGIDLDVRIDWAGRWAGRVGGLSWVEACMTDNLRDVLRELLNSCAPMILDALIDGVIEAEGAKLKARSPQHDRYPENELDADPV